MKLAFDVSDRISSFSWRCSNGVPGRRAVDSGKAAEILLPAIQQIQEETGETLTALGVVTGPGSFTGIRVGLSTALGLQHATGIPVYGFDKFRLVTHHLGNSAYHLLLPAGKREVILARFADGRLRGEPEIIAKEALIPDAGQVVIKPINGVEAANLNLELTELCLDLMALHQDYESFPLEPLYIRPPDAKKNSTLIDRLLSQTQ